MAAVIFARDKLKPTCDEDVQVKKVATSLIPVSA